TLPLWLLGFARLASRLEFFVALIELRDLLPGEDLMHLCAEARANGIELRLHGLEQRADLALASEGERIQRRTLRLRQPEVVEEPGARAVLRREPLVAEHAIGGEPENAADEHGSEQEHQRLLFGALHRDSYRLCPKRKRMIASRS